MLTQLLGKLQDSIRRYSLPRAVTVSALVGAIAVSVLVVFWPVQPTDTPVPSAEQVQQHPDESRPEFMPTRIRVPSVGIDAPFEEPLGLEVTQEIEVPEAYDTVGWYQYSPQPGHLGPSVVLGHVDSYRGPAVFYPLQNISADDEIFIDRADGSTVVFSVTDIEDPPQSAFPTERVYGDIDHAGLRLITCSGTFDHGTQRYSHNRIVYATLVRTESALASSTATTSADERSDADISRDSFFSISFLSERYDTLWWLLIVGMLFAVWTTYDDYLTRTDVASRVLYRRNILFSAVYVVAVALCFKLGLLDALWWVFLLAWVAMTTFDYLSHKHMPLWSSRLRNITFTGVGAIFISTSFIFGFPLAWWPFFVLAFASGLLYFLDAD